MKKSIIYYEKENTGCLEWVELIKKHNDYPEGDEKFDLTKLRYISLKNALNSWMKEARNLFYEPKVIIGYID